MSLALAVLFSVLALLVATKHDDFGNNLAAAGLLATAILSHHFTGMSAVTVIPDPMQVSETSALSPVSVSVLVAGAAAIILGMCLVASLSDRRSRDKLQRQKYLLDVALKNMSQGLCMFDADGRVLMFNDRYIAMMGLPGPSLTGQSLLEVLKMRKMSGGFTGDPEEFFVRVMADIRSGKSGYRITESSSGRSLRIIEQPMSGGGWVATFEDITEWRKLQEELSHLAHDDSLTELPNRAKFYQQLEQALRQTRRSGQIAVLYLDLDHFKEINDTLGHAAGDELLKQVAGRLVSCVREGDTVARLGGDEFAIVQVSNDQKTSAPSSLADRLVAFVGTPYDIHGHRCVIGVSIGISISSNGCNDADILLRAADAALYHAKESGRGTYRFAEAEAPLQPNSPDDGFSRTALVSRVIG
jgi:diguanylate cyclase (GGDEF)-like protein